MPSTSRRGRASWTGLAVTLFSVLASATATSSAAGSSSSKCPDASTYDYVVVGSGPGGGLVASNLALAGHSVLLIEAGSDATADLGTSVNALSYPTNEANQWSFFVKHHSDAETESRYRLLTWTLPDGSYWIGTKAQAPAGATLNGVW